MRLFKQGKSAEELGIPAYSNWDDFVADKVLEPDGDNGDLHESYKHLITKEMMDAHKKETK